MSAARNPCLNCGRQYKPLRKGRCKRCYAFHRRRGVEASIREGEEFVAVEGQRGRVRPLQLVVPSSPVELAYVAGIIDGEGCITRWRSGAWGVQVGMTHCGVIAHLAEMGGTLSTRPARERKQEQFVWRVLAQRDVVALLDALLPFLRVKRARARECLDELLALERVA